MDVLLVAAKKDMINDYTSVCAEAGLTATVVDVDAFAVQNAFEANYPQAPGRDGGAHQRGRRRHQHQHRHQRASPPSPATSPWAATPSPRRSRSSSTSPTTRPRPSRWAGTGETDAVVPAGGRAGHPGRRRPDGRRDPALARLLRRHRRPTATSPGSTSRAARRASRRSSRSSSSGPGCPVEILNPFKNIEVDNRKFDPAVIMDAAPGCGGGGRPRAPPPRGQVAMIRINLLPVRVSKKKEAGRQQLLLFAPRRASWPRRQLGVGLARAPATWRPARPSCARTKDEIAQLERIIGEVKDIKAQQAALQGEARHPRQAQGGPHRAGEAARRARHRSSRAQLWLTEDGREGRHGHLRRVGAPPSTTSRPS